MRFFVTLFLLWTSLLSAAETRESTEQAAVRQAVLRTLSDLKANPQQMKLFDAEVLRHPQTGFSFFVTNYRISEGEEGEKVQVDIDRQKLHQYINFSSPQTGVGVCIFTYAPADCDRCTKLLEGYRGQIIEKFSKRGFAVKTPEIQIETEDTEQRFQRAMEVSLEEKCAAVFLGEVLENQAAPQSSGHAPTTPPVLRATTVFQMTIQDPFSAGIKKVKARTNFVLPAVLLTSFDQNIPQSASVLALGSTIEVFTQAAKQGVVLTTEKSMAAAQRFLRIDNATYQSYARVKEAVITQISGVSLEERFISRRSFRFALSSDLSTEELVTKIKKIKIEEVSFDLKRVQSPEGEEIALILK